MRWPVALLGLVAGLVAGFALVSLNPLVAVGRLAPLPASAITKRYAPDDVAGMTLDLPGLLGRGAAGDDALPDAVNRGTRIGLAVLPAGDGQPAALVVKVSVLSPQNSLLRARLGTLDYWTIVWPGEGGVFATGYSNYWALASDVVWAILRGRGRAGLAAEYPLSALPPVAEDTGVSGASGRFRAATGEIRETLAPRPDGPPQASLTIALDTAPAP